MSDWKAKRFWKNVTVEEDGDGYAVRLDGRPVNSPGKSQLILPSREMAEQVAAEWDAQIEVIDPRVMPWTRSANSALDKVSPQLTEVADHLAEYAGTDMVSYRATHPEELISRQMSVWDPLMQKVDATYGAKLETTSGVMPISQPKEALMRLRAAMDGMTAFALTGFHDLVTIPGSFVIALAAVNEWETLDDLWQAARLDELWQIEQWGVDEEAEALAERKRGEFFHAAAFYRAAL